MKFCIIPKLFWRNYQELFIFECILAVCSASQFENRNNQIEYYWALLYYKNSGKYPIFWAISIKPIDSLPPILFFLSQKSMTHCHVQVSEQRKRKKLFSPHLLRALCSWNELIWRGDNIIQLRRIPLDSKKSWFDPKSGVAITAPDSIIKITSKSHKNGSGHYKCLKLIFEKHSFIWKFPLDTHSWRSASYHIIKHTNLIKKRL